MQGSRFSYFLSNLIESFLVFVSPKYFYYEKNFYNFNSCHIGS
jgi:hypothetical protein